MSCLPVKNVYDVAVTQSSGLRLKKRGKPSRTFRRASWEPEGEDTVWPNVKFYLKSGFWWSFNSLCS